MATQVKPDKLIDRVAAALKSSFPGATLELEPCGRGHVTGEITWNGFGVHDEYGDQVVVSKALEEKLGRDAKKVVMLFTLTPAQKKDIDRSRLEEEESILATAKRILQERRQAARSKKASSQNGHHPATKKRKSTTHG
jgi:hypothetical protein